MTYILTHSLYIFIYTSDIHFVCKLYVYIYNAYVTNIACVCVCVWVYVIVYDCIYINFYYLLKITK